MVWFFRFNQFFYLLLVSTHQNYKKKNTKKQVNLIFIHVKYTFKKSHENSLKFKCTHKHPHEHFIN
jgi:hypothetical protein